MSTCVHLFAGLGKHLPGLKRLHRMDVVSETAREVHLRQVSLRRCRWVRIPVIFMGVGLNHEKTGGELTCELTCELSHLSGMNQHKTCMSNHSNMIYNKYGLP
jgi:hypothetical protein